MTSMRSKSFCLRPRRGTASRESGTLGDSRGPVGAVRPVSGGALSMKWLAGAKQMVRGLGADLISATVDLYEFWATFSPSTATMTSPVRGTRGLET